MFFVHRKLGVFGLARDMGVLFLERWVTLQFSLRVRWFCVVILQLGGSLTIGVKFACLIFLWIFVNLQKARVWLGNAFVIEHLCDLFQL